MRSRHYLFFADGWEPFLQQFLLAGKHFLAQFVEVHLKLFGLRQHFVFFFLDVVTDVLGQYRELRVEVIAVALRVL